jgi:NitT/TauT family transport system substrate-binding protein
VTLAGAEGLLGLHARPGTAEPPPETARLRLVKAPAICLSPEYLAEDLLRLEGFSEIDYVEIEQGTTQDLLLANKADLTVHVPPALLPDLDAGKPLIVLAGLHGGCYELFTNEHVRAIRDLKGKRVAVNTLGGAEYYFIAAMVAYVGMDPRQDLEWVDAQRREPLSGQMDAPVGYEPFDMGNSSVILSCSSFLRMLRSSLPKLT